MAKKLPSPLDYPHIARAISARGGNYRRIEVLTPEQLREAAIRLRICAETAESAISQMDSMNEKAAEVVAVSSLMDAIQSAERHAGVIMDCLTQLRVHRSVAEGGKKPRH